MNQRSRVYRLPTYSRLNEKSKKRHRMSLAMIILILCAMLVTLAVIWLQQAQSIQQDAAIRELSARMTAVEHRTRETWRRLGFSEAPPAEIILSADREPELDILLRANY